MDISQTFGQRQGLSNIGLFGALTASLGLHLLIFWWLTDSMVLSPSLDENPTREKTLRLKLAWLGPTEPETTSSQPTSHPKPIEPRPPKPEDRIEKPPVTPLETDKPKEKPAPTNRPSTQELLRSANQVAREIAKTSPDGSNQEGANQDSHRDTTSVSARLNRALNPQREAAGVSVRADGTTRVVTDWGYTYCIKPLDDGQILDPEDDIRTSMYCR